MKLYREPQESHEDAQRPGVDAGASAPVDLLLRDFFRQEMPANWPALQLLQPVQPPRRRQRLQTLRSYLALAASLLLLALGLMIKVDAPPSGAQSGASKADKAPFGPDVMRKDSNGRTIPAKPVGGPPGK